MSTLPNGPEHASTRVVQASPTGPVLSPAPRDGAPPRRGPGQRFTPERARAIAIEREARRREARRLAAERGDVADTAAHARSGSGDSSAPRIVHPTGIDLPAIVLGDLVDNGRGCLVLREALASPRIDANPRPAGETLDRPRSPQRGAVPDLALPRGARLPAPRPVEVEVPELEREPANPVPVDPAAEKAAQAMQAACGRVARRHLAERLANPQRAAFSLPWEPAVPLVGGICSGCSVAIAADRRAGHAVQQATRFPRGQKERCVEWALGITS